MPLIKSSKPQNVAKNISEFHAGERYKQTAKKFGKKRADEQAIAIALDIARKVKNRAFGGPLSYAPPIYTTPSFQYGLDAGSIPAMKSGGSADHDTKGYVKGHKIEKYGTGKITKGPIISAVPGRTDAHATHVPSGSYVIPADIVSGRGEGNTLAGLKNLQRMFKLEAPPPHKPAPKFTSPLPAKTGKYSGGGKDSSGPTGTPVRVNLAGGEIVIPPENLMTVVHPNLKRAHELMDAWVLSERKKLRKTLAKLPGPAKD